MKLIQSKESEGIGGALWKPMTILCGSPASKEVAEKLKLIAEEYQAKAARLGNGELPRY